MNTCIRLITVFLIALLTRNAQATDYLITTGVDGIIDDGNCTLREALISADTASAVDACPVGEDINVITLDSTVGTFTFNQGDMELTRAQELTLQTSNTQSTAPIISMGLNNRFLGTEEAGVVVNISNIDFFLGRDTSGEGGGVIWMNSTSGTSDLWIEDSKFLTNTSVDADGGAILYRGVGTVSITGSLFQGNTAESGGAILIDLVGNSSEFHDARVLHSDFINNESQAGRGALTILHNAPQVRSQVFIVSLTGNVASDGDGIAGLYLDLTDDAIARLINVSIEDSDGAGVYADNTGGSLTMERFVLKDNYQSGSQGIHQMILQSSEFGISKVSNLLMYHTQIQQGIGLLAGVVASSEPNDQIQVQFATIVNHAIGVLGNSTATQNFTKELLNSIVYNNIENLINFDEVTGSLIGVDPLFTDIANEDFTLSVNSPGIDISSEYITTGVRSFEDIIINPRPYGGLFDAGAYEVQGPVNVNVSHIGSGSGNVKVGTQECFTDCTFVIQSDSFSEVEAEADVGSVIGLWGGACDFVVSGQTSCFLGKSAIERNVTVQFVEDADVIFYSGFD